MTFHKRDSESPDRSPLDSPEGHEELKKFTGGLLTINHDMNNCLAGVLGYLELAVMDETKLPPKTLELLQAAQKSATLLEKQVQRISASKRDLQKKVDLLQLLPFEQPQ